VCPYKNLLVTIAVLCLLGLAAKNVDPGILLFFAVRLEASKGGEVRNKMSVIR